MTNYAFVYGTLKQGFGNHRVINDARFVCTDVLDGHCMYSLGAFPYIIEGDPGDAVIGEVYEVGPKEMESMDILEGYPLFYNRKRVTTRSGHECWVYFFDEPTNDSVVEEGEW